MKLVLEIIRNDDELISSKEYQLNSEICYIGRSEECDLHLNDPKSYISSKHAFIEYRDNNYFITDISSNGTYFKLTKQYLEKNAEIIIEDGDIFIIGDYELKATLYDDDSINYDISKETQIKSMPNFQEIISDDFLFSNDSSSEGSILFERDSSSENIMDFFKKEENEPSDIETITNEIEHIHTDIDIYGSIKESHTNEHSIPFLNILEKNLDIDIKNLKYEEQKAVFEEISLIIKTTLDSIKTSLQVKNNIEKEIINKNDDFVILNPLLREENILKSIVKKETEFNIKDEIQSSFKELDRYCLALHKTNKDLVQSFIKDDVAIQNEYKKRFIQNLSNIE